MGVEVKFTNNVALAPDKLTIHSEEVQTSNPFIPYSPVRQVELSGDPDEFTVFSTPKPKHEEPLPKQPVDTDHIAAGFGGEPPHKDPPFITFPQDEPDNDSHNLGKEKNTGEKRPIKPDNSRIDVARYGGKLGSMVALENEGYPVPPFKILDPGDETNTKLMEALIRDMGGRTIVRASSPADWFLGDIDTLITQKNIKTPDQLAAAIAEIRKGAASQERKEHAADWNYPFDPNVHIFAQRQSASSVGGSCLEHPHIEGQIDFNYIDRFQREIDPYVNFSSARFFRDGHYYHTPHMTNAGDDQLELAYEMFTQMKKDGLIDPQFSYQMEMGFPFEIYQLRVLREKQPAAQFRLPISRVPNINSHLVFGVTRPEGIEVDFRVEDPWETIGNRRYRGKNTNIPYGLILSGRLETTMPMNVHFGNLQAVAVTSGANNYLEHGDFRHIKRNLYCMVGYYYHDIKDPESIKHGARYISNGRNAMIVPAEHAEAAEEYTKGTLQ